MELDILKLGLDPNLDANKLNTSEIEHRQQLEIETLVKSVSELNEFILLHARTLECSFRQQYKTILQSSRTLAKEERKNELTHIRMTVRMTRFHTVEMSWNRIKYINNKSAKSGPKLITEYIKRPPKSYAYSPQIFAEEPKWVRESGIRIEKKMAVLRQQAALLSNIRENLFRLSRLVSVYGELLRQDSEQVRDEDLSLLDELMGLESHSVEDHQKQTHQTWITTSSKCQIWMAARRDSAIKSIG